LITYCSQSEKQQLLDAIENKDREAWQEITKPIIHRMAMYKMSKERRG
jgi:hypothetical protein